MKRTCRTKLIHEGPYMAEVEVVLLEVEADLEHAVGPLLEEVAPHLEDADHVVELFPVAQGLDEGGVAVAVLLALVADDRHPLARPDDPRHRHRAHKINRINPRPIRERRTLRRNQ